jgi:hypothetical protein
MQFPSAIDLRVQIYTFLYRYVRTHWSPSVLETAFATIVIGIVAVVSVIHSGMHAAIFGPEEETSGIKLATRVVSSARSSGTCTIAGENKGVKPYVFSADCLFGFMCRGFIISSFVVVTYGKEVRSCRG